MEMFKKGDQVRTADRPTTGTVTRIELDSGDISVRVWVRFGEIERPFDPAQLSLVKSEPTDAAK